jgi:hypothetical protein
MKIINLTPHAITADGVVIPPSGDIARVSVTRTKRGDINGIPVFVPTFGVVAGLPDPALDTVYLVSAMVRNHPAVASRTDVCSPGALVRDDAGNIIGCDGLDFNASPQ